VESGKVLYDGLYVGFKATGTDFGFFAAVTLADFKSLAAKNNDTLTFKIEITMLGEPTTFVQPRAADEAAAAHAAVVKDLGALLDGGDEEIPACGVPRRRRGDPRAPPAACRALARLQGDVRAALERAG
jgi:hypothetical protein